MPLCIVHDSGCQTATNSLTQWPACSTEGCLDSCIASKSWLPPIGTNQKDITCPAQPSPSVLVKSDTCHALVKSDTCHALVKSDKCHTLVKSDTCHTLVKSDICDTHHPLFGEANTPRREKMCTFLGVQYLSCAVLGLLMHCVCSCVRVCVCCF